MPPKKSNSKSNLTSTSVGAIAGEAGMTGANLTPREVIALRVLVAFIEGKNGQISPDMVEKDIVPIANKFADLMGWDR